MKKITHEGVLSLSNNLQLPCYILEDGTRVISGRGMQNALQIIPLNEDKPEEMRSGGELGRFMAGRWFKALIATYSELVVIKPIICYKGQQKINGYEATSLVDFCNLILDARRRGRVKSERQEIIANQCQMLVEALAKVGIIALVDEATGYQYEREKDELQKILKAYINSELLPWQKKFPDEFYKEIFRLNGWSFTVSGIKQRPGVIGKWTKDYVYRQLPRGVLEQLIKNTPKNASGKLVKKLHQSLTEDVGNPHLNKQLISVITLMNVSRNWNEFIRFFNRKFGQQEIPFDDNDMIEPRTPKRK